MRKLLLASTALVALTISAQAQKSILTGSEGGAYNSTFCPPLPEALKQNNFQGYRCTPSGGTLDNINGVLTKPTNVGFVQLDVFAREQKMKPDMSSKLTIIRNDIACEGLWMVTKNPRIKNFGDVIGNPRLIPFIIGGENSGSAASFKYLQSLDPDGLGRAKNVKYVQDTKTMLNNVAASDDNSIGFFVQFADPENANIKLMMEKGLTVVPVVSREISNAKVDGQELYQVQTFSLKSGGIFISGDDRVTSCTPVAVITGNPDAQTDRDAKDDQKDIIQAIRDVPAKNLLPSDSRLAKLISGARKLGVGALNEMLAAADSAKKAAEKLAN